MRMLKIFYLKKSKERHYSNLYSKTGLLSAEYRVSYLENLERKQVFVGHISPKITTYSKIKSFNKSRQNHFLSFGKITTMRVFMGSKIQKIGVFQY